MSKKLRCLITGGAGFIGSHVADYMRAQGHEVVLVDNFYRGKSKFQEKWAKDFNLIEGSIVDRDLIFSLVENSDVVFHFAAILGVKTTMTKPVELIETNIQGTKNVLEAALQFGVKVIFASTSEVYGKGEPPFTETKDRLYGETTKLRWSYAVSKTLEETLCLGYAEKGLPVTILRYFNVFGPRAKEGPYAGVIPRFIAAAVDGEDLQVYGDGQQTRCFTYIDDVVEMTVKAISPDVNKEILNIGSLNHINIQNLAELVKEKTNSNSHIVQVPFDVVYPKGFEEIPNRFPDMTKTKELLGYEAKISLEEGLQRTIDWYKGEM